MIQGGQILIRIWPLHEQQGSDAHGYISKKGNISEVCQSLDYTEQEVITHLTSRTDLPTIMGNHHFISPSKDPIPLMNSKALGFISDVKPQPPRPLQ